jgi:hypothetical protein
MVLAKNGAHVACEYECESERRKCTLLDFNSFPLFFVHCAGGGSVVVNYIRVFAAELRLEKNSKSKSKS